MPAFLDLLQQTQTGVALAVLALLLMLEGAHPFFDFYRVRKGRGRHAVRNLVLGLVNGGLVAVGFAGLWVAVAAWADTHGWGLLNLLRDGAGLPGWAHAVGAMLLLDAWTYTWHRLNHRVPFLWRFHRVHHADTRMDVTTASRFHTGEIVLSSLLRVGVIALVGVYAWELVLYETLMFAVVQFHHANLGLPSGIDRALRTVMVTPNLHKVHHSRLQPETDSNYSALFSWWDRLFGSFRLRTDPEGIQFGLDEFLDEEHESLSGMLRMPLADGSRTPHPTDAP